MIEYIEGNLLDADEPIIAHGVNCMGQMNSGIAFQIKQRYPSAFEDYRQYLTKFENPYYALGSFTSSIIPGVSNSRQLFHLFTQYGQKNDAVLVDVIYVLIRLDKYLSAHGHTNGFAIPKIGCGVGGLSWEDEVLPQLEKFTTPIRVYVYNELERNLIL